MGHGLKKAFWVMSFYLFYACVREAIISRLMQPSQWRSFRIRLTNQITVSFAVYFAIFYFLISFGLADEKIFPVMFGCIPGIVLTFITHIFWVFPAKGDKPLLKGINLRRLIGSSLLWAIPFSFLFVIAIDEPKVFVPFLLSALLVQLFLITPIAWFIYRWRKDSILRFRGLEIALDQSEADLQFLRSQINPHFLFNSLNTLYGTALQENAFRAAEGIQKLGDMMRFMLHENHQEKIPMYKEIEYLKNYIDLQKLRLSKKTALSFNFSGETDQQKIPPLVLMTFIENVFKYGVSKHEPSIIRINLNVIPGKILFECENTMFENRPAASRKGIGIANTRQRLQHIYPGKHRLNISSVDALYRVELEIDT